MRALVRTALLSLGLGTVTLLGGAGAADAHPRHGADVDVLDGSTQIQVDVCGNAVGVLGDAEASCEGSQDAGGSTRDGADGGGSTRDGADGSGFDAILGGPTSEQANACGNSVGVGGDAEATCEGSQEARANAPDDGNGANEIDVLRWGLVVQASACGNAVGAVGDAHASCDGSQDAEATAGDGTGGGGSDADVGGATQAQANACGNAVGVLGDARASCQGPQTSPGDDEPGQETPGMPPTGVLGAGGGPALLGPLPVTGASFDRLAIAMLFLVGFSAIWATGRGEEDGPQR